MSERRTGGSRESAAPGRAGRMGERFDSSLHAWDHLAEVEDRSELSREWLSLLVAMIQGVRLGLVLLREEGGEGFLPAAVWPEGARGVDKLALVAHEALKEGEAVFRDGGEVQPGGCARVAQPLVTNGRAWGVVVLEVEPRSDERLRGVVRGLQASSGWLRRLDPFQEVTPGSPSDAGARVVLSSIAVLAEEEGLQAAALGLAIRLEQALACERVSVGMMRKGHVRVMAVSSNPDLAQEALLMRFIEGAMEEACDQDTTVQHPVPEGAPFMVTIAHRAHARAHGHGTILSAPLERNGELVGAITLERREGRAFSEEEVLTVDAIAALAGPQLELARRDEASMGAKLGGRVRSATRSLLGPRKRRQGLVLVALLVGLIFAALKQTDHRVTSDVYLEAQRQLLLATPVRGYVLEAPARAGDVVKKGQLLYRLDGTDLRLERDRLVGEEAQARKRHLKAMASGVSADVRILAAQLAQVRAEVELAEELLGRVSVYAPMDGVVVSGDLSQSIGSPLDRGQVVYSIAPLDDFRVVFQVSDADIDECAVGQHGHIVLSAMPEREWEVRLERVTPVSISEEGRPHFRVEASLLGGTPRGVLRPGMEGVGKVDVGRRSLLWTWTHSVVDRFRLFWWRWTP